MPCITSKHSRRRHGPPGALPGPDSEDVARFSCRRCGATLRAGDWRPIGPDTVTGVEVRVCEGCWRELKAEPALASAKGEIDSGKFA
jgi:hypothetical protein